MNMGKSVVLSPSDPVDIAIISRHIEPYDPECFRSCMEPKAYEYVMLKAEFTIVSVSKTWRNRVVECAGRGSVHRTIAN